MKVTLIIFIYLMSATSWANSKCSQVLEQYEKVHPRNTWEYDWTTSIFLYGALAYTAKYPQSFWGKETLETLFMDLNKKAPSITTPDLASMSLPATLVSGDGAKSMRELSKEYFKTEPLNSIGAIDHVGHRHKFAWFLPPTHWFSPSALWADSIIMYALNGFTLARIENNKERMIFFLEQIILFEKYLKDDETGLYKHAYYLKSGKKYPYDGFWARGNLWIDLGLIEIIGMMPSDLPLYEKLKSILSDHISAIKKVSDSSGLHTVLDDKESYIETSSTALLAYVLKKGIRMNLFDKTYDSWAQAMVNASLEKIENGNVLDISGPTTAFPYSFYYKYLVRPGRNISYGVGAILLMCSEI